MSGGRIDLAELKATAIKCLPNDRVTEWYDVGEAPTAAEVLALIEAVEAAQALNEAQATSAVSWADEDFAAEVEAKERYADALARFDFGGDA